LPAPASAPLRLFRSASIRLITLPVDCGISSLTYLYPPLAHRLLHIIDAASALGEIPLELWLIVMGVNAQRWKEQASATRSSEGQSES